MISKKIMNSIPSNFFVAIGLQSYNDVYFQVFNLKQDAIDGIIKEIKELTEDGTTFEHEFRDELNKHDEILVYGEEYRFFIKEISQSFEK
jgi:hypothetical protein